MKQNYPRRSIALIVLLSVLTTLGLTACKSTGESPSQANQPAQTEQPNKAEHPEHPK